VSQSADVVVEHVSKAFDGGRIQALQDVSLAIEPAAFVALVGPSGCGKSTLLNLIGLLDRPDSGSITVGGDVLERHPDPCEYRASTVGFVFQFHNLVPTLNALENVQIPMFHRLPRRKREARARLLADEPTGSLDTATGGQVLELIARLRDDYGMTVLMVTNDDVAAEAADRTLALRDGIIRAVGLPAA